MSKQLGLPLGAGLGVPLNGTDSVSASCGRCVRVWMPEDSAIVMFGHTLTGCVGAWLHVCMPLAHRSTAIGKLGNCAVCGAKGAQYRVSSVFSQQGSCMCQPLMSVDLWVRCL